MSRLNIRQLHSLVGLAAVAVSLTLMFVLISIGQWALAFIVPACILVLACWWVLATRPRI